MSWVLYTDSRRNQGMSGHRGQDTTGQVQDSGGKLLVQVVQWLQRNGAPFSFSLSLWFIYKHCLSGTSPEQRVIAIQSNTAPFLIAALVLPLSPYLLWAVLGILIHWFGALGVWSQGTFFSWGRINSTACLSPGHWRVLTQLFEKNLPRRFPVDNDGTVHPSEFNNTHSSRLFISKNCM